jgi:hypothetical protein
MIVRLWLRHYSGTIFSSDDVVYSTLDELVPASDIHREDKDLLGMRRGETKANTIEIYKLDIY